MDELFQVTRESRYGIDCCLQDRDNLQYSIKVRPSCDDFIVTEESKSGERALIAPQILPAYPVQKTKAINQAVPGEPAKKKLDLGNSGIESESWSSADGHLCWRVLEHILTPVCLAEIVGLARIAAEGHSALKVCSEIYIDLTCIEGKHQRTMVHRCMRTVFPHLVTRTDQSKNAIVVGLDPSFSALHSSGCNIIDCFRILWFQHAYRYKFLETKSEPFLDIVVNSDRSVRSKIHHTIRRCFGGGLESKTQTGVAKNNLQPPIILPPDYDKVFGGVGSSSMELANSTPSRCAHAAFGAASQAHDMCSNTPISLPGDEQESQQFIQLRYRMASIDKKRTASGSTTRTPDCFLHFVLEKTKMETLGALRCMSHLLGNRISDFSYAGTKDCHAITRQFMCVSAVRAEQLAAIAEPLAKNGIRTGSYCYHSSRLHLGDLKGNHFEIVLSDVHAPCQSQYGNQGASKVQVSTPVPVRGLQQQVAETSAHGFINYYGPQRFGALSLGPASQDVGLAMLCGNNERAVRLLLTPGCRSKSKSSNDDCLADDAVGGECLSSSPPTGADDSVETVDSKGVGLSLYAAKRYFVETDDAKGALKRLHKRNVREGLLLSSLVRYAGDSDRFRNALMSLPHDARSFYVHAYTSRLWNACASYRLQRYGKAVCTGDAVRAKPSKSVDSLSDGGAVLDGETHSTADATGRSNPCTDLPAGGNDVIILTESDQLLGYSLADVIIPILGHRGVPESSNLFHFVSAYLEADSLTLAAFKISSLDLRLRGSFRPLLAFPSGLRVSAVCSACQKAQHQPDAGLETCGVSGVTPASKHDNSEVEPAPGTDCCHCQSPEVAVHSPTHSLSYKLQFSLPPSTYATSLLYQLMGFPQ